MKIRKLFVSNSSSCSFFVWLKTDDDVQRFNKIKDEFVQKFGKFIASIYKSPKDRWNEISLFDNNIEKGNVIHIETGEDNEGYFREQQLDDIYNYLYCKYKEFKIYSDPDAHCTRGSEYIDDIKND